MCNSLEENFCQILVNSFAGSGSVCDFFGEFGDFRLNLLQFAPAPCSETKAKGESPEKKQDFFEFFLIWNCVWRDFVIKY